MFEYWAEQIRQSLAALEWVSRSGGLAEVLTTTDGGTSPVRFPVVPTYPDAPCNEGENYVRVAPHEGESAIAFVQADSIMNPMRTSGNLDFQTTLSVVVWYDTRHVLTEMPGDDLSWLITSQISEAVKATNLNQSGLTVHKIKFSGTRHNSRAIWSPLGLTDETLNLSTLPYRTLAIDFKVWARVQTGCFVGNVVYRAEKCLV